MYASEIHIRIHPTNKPWMTPNMKAKIRLRQQAFTPGNMSQYNLLCVKVEDMIRKAKSNYYHSKLIHSAHLTLRNGSHL